MNCKDCIHNEMCLEKCDGIDTFALMRSEKVKTFCPNFKDKSEWVHPPCKKGDVLIRNGIRCIVDHWNVIATAFTEDDKCRLFGLKEAEKSLENMRKEDEGK